ncbi:MAG: ABC transporter substrate-binding protein [Dehalococcoidia bacterium]|jgi:peptide/nickel transport system substrate-binding protein
MSSARARWLLLLTLAVGILALGAVWYKASRLSEAHPPQPGGTYVEGVAGAPSHINPLFDSTNDVDKDLVALIFSGLTRLGPDGEVLPDLAESWDISNDGLTYTFHLRDGVLWHDGQPFTADDVVFTFKALQDDNYRGEPARAELFRSLTVAKIDDLTVTITLAQPFAPVLAYLSIGILPQHLLGDLDASQLYASPFNQQPVGTGPFRLVDLSGDHAVLTSNPTYHLGEPYLRRLELRFYTDEPTLLKALKDGQVLGAFFRSPLSDVDRQYLEGNDRWQILQLPSTTYTILYFNDTLPQLQDKQVRQALAYATDRDTIAATILDNQAVRSDSPIPAGTWAYYSALDGYSYDPTQAASLLDQAGWVLQLNGVRAKDGQELRLNLVTNSDDLRTAVAGAIARAWSALGVQTTVSTQQPTNLLRDMLMPHQFDVALYGFDSGLDPDPYPAWHSSQTAAGGNNLAGFADPQSDALLEQARQTSDVATRKVLYRQFQEIFATEMPSLPLYQRTLTYVIDGRLQGVEPLVLFDSSSRFTEVRQWHLEAK